MPGNSRAKVIETIRTRRAQITEAWRKRVSTLPNVSRIPSPSVADHIPEFLHELATWLAGKTESPSQAYGRLVQGHALQRLSYGISLATLLDEYMILREVILTELLAVESDADVRAALVDVNLALDGAIAQSVHAFAARREEVRERFVSILGHDLRNPLQALMLGAEQILANPACGQPAHARLASAIHRGADRMARMIRDLVDFALGHLGGGIPTVLATCDMGEICRECVDELRAAHPDRTLALSVRGDLKGSWDRDRVLQLISNLVSNALVHGHDPISVKVWEEADREAVVVAVHNGGPPIPADAVPTLFEPFRRGAKASRGGLGLGLYIVNQIALAHGATVEVTSTVEEGTMFTLRWPRTPLTVVPRPDQPQA